MTNHTDARGFATAFQYSNRRELTNTIAPTNLTVKVSIDAADNVASSTDARGNTTTNDLERHSSLARHDHACHAAGYASGYQCL